MSKNQGISHKYLLLRSWQQPSRSPDIQTADIQTWTRQQLAQFVLDNDGLIRSIAAKKLSANAKRSSDSEDILQTVLRRMDQLATRGSIRAQSPRQLLALTAAIAENCATDRTRLVLLANRHLSEDGAFARILLDRLSNEDSEGNSDILILEMFAALDTPEERQYLGLRARGVAHAAIAQFFNISDDAARQRWQVIRGKLTDRFERGENDEQR